MRAARASYDRCGAYEPPLPAGLEPSARRYSYQLKTVGTTHFEYDAFGRRIRKLNGGYASTDYQWDGMRLVQETYHDCQGEEALTYLYESNSYVPLARIDQGKAAATVSALPARCES